MWLGSDEIVRKVVTLFSSLSVTTTQTGVKSAMNPLRIFSDLDKSYTTVQLVIATAAHLDVVWGLQLVPALVWHVLSACNGSCCRDLWALDVLETSEGKNQRYVIFWILQIDPSTASVENKNLSVLHLKGNSWQHHKNSPIVLQSD